MVPDFVKQSVNSKSMKDLLGLSPTFASTSTAKEELALMFTQNEHLSVINVSVPHSISLEGLNPDLADKLHRSLDEDQCLTFVERLVEKRIPHVYMIHMRTVN